MVKTKQADNRSAAKSEEYVRDSSSDSVSEATSESDSDIQTKTSIIEAGSKGSNKSNSEDETDHEDPALNNVPPDSRKKKRKSALPSQVELSSTRRSKISKIPLSSARDAYNPPLGYTLIQSRGTDHTSDVDQMFSKLDGKQVWHITAPSTVPVAKIESLDVATALRGEPILHHKGSSYNMFATAPRGEVLLLPQGTDGLYLKSHVGVARSFHLREVPRINTLDSSKIIAEGSKAASDEGIECDQDRFFASVQGMKKPPREQPPGLFMRYQPYGKQRTSSEIDSLPNPEIESQ